MTWDPSDWCAPLSAWRLEGDRPLSTGEGGALNLLYLERGDCVLSGAGGALFSAGGLLVCPGPETLEPTGPAALQGLALTGAAALALAGQLGGPRLVPAAVAQGLSPQLAQLAEDPAAWAQPGGGSVPAYALLCAVYGALSREDTVPTLVAAAMQHMRQHYGEVYGIEEVATALGVSKSHLIRRFSHSLGMSPGRYLTAVRLDAAKRLLLHPEYSLESIAGLCGFSGANYLCRLFKKEVGLSPSAWRRQNTAPTVPPTAPEWEEALYL